MDLRSYTGKHYETITDLLGADYAIDISDETWIMVRIPEKP